VLWTGGIHAAQTELLPRWELGMGAAAVSLPDYRGSDESSKYLLPFPLVVYRFDWLKADRNGVRATLFDSERMELNMSMGATPPIKSKNNAAREGMPDIKPMIEFGPSLDFNLWRSSGDNTRLNLLLPVRAAFEVGNDMRLAGLVFTPKLNLDFSALGMPEGSTEGWRLGLVAGPLFADQQQNAYFYSVDPQYARADRPAYTAKAGYSGAQFLTSLSRRFGKAWVGAYARWDSLKGATFEDSPLVKRNSYATYGVAVTWTFAQSEDKVEVSRD